MAVDPDKERISIARKENARENIEYQIGDDKSFPEDQYDLVFANAVLHWVKDKEELFKRVYANLCSGGVFAFTTNNGKPSFPPVITQLFQLVHPQLLDMIYFKKAHFEDSNAYQKLASSAGFSVLFTEIEEFPHKFDGVDSVLDYHFALLHGELNPASVDVEALQNFKKAHEDEVRNQPIVKNALYMILKKH